jgi:hypothetical protein
MLTEYACCPRCLGDLIEQERRGKREFACLQCGDTGGVLPAEEYIARKVELAASRREMPPNPFLTTA